MPDLLAGTTVQALDTPPTVADTETGSYTFTNTTFGVGTTGGTYADCAVVFVAPTTGRVLLHYAAHLWHSSTGAAIIAPVVRAGATIGSGTVIVAATADNMIQVQGTSGHRYGASLLVTGLTPGDTYNVRLEHSIFGAGTGTALRRHLVAAPAT